MVELCGATLSMDELDGTFKVAVADRVEDRNVKARAGRETTLISYKFRRETAVRQEKYQEQNKRALRK